MLRSLCTCCCRRGGVTFKELGEARLLIEPEMAGLAAANANRSNVRPLREALAKLESSGHDAEAHIQGDVLLHHEIAVLCKQAVYSAIFDAIQDVVLWSMRLGVSVPGAVALADRQHRAIVDAIVARDAEAARTLMQSHIKTVSDRTFRSEYTPGAAKTRKQQRTRAAKKDELDVNKGN